MDLLVPSTPSPASGIHTPTTPKHGFEDSWEPYSPRKSARIAKRANNRTPSPQSANRRAAPRADSAGSPRSSKKTSSTMATPAMSPRKKRTTTATAGPGLSGKTESRMLPTPAKTPQQPPTEQSKANVRSVARNLFHTDEEVMPSPSKTRGKKHILDSFSIDDAEEPPITIFTDTHERIPEVDLSADNPFYDPPAANREPAKRRGKRQFVAIPGEGKVPVEDAVRRNDGMVTVFRGKKQFRKFADNDELRRSARSSVQPKLLFPTHQQQREGANAADDDEEAATDIEDTEPTKTSAEKPQTPTDLMEGSPGTPAAPKFAPASPPTTSRTTRHGTKSAPETTPVKPTRASKRSPFDGWRRVKTPGSEGHGQKRPGDELTNGPAKKSRA